VALSLWGKIDSEGNLSTVTMSTKEEEKKESFLARSKMFKSITKRAFDACDGDGSGKFQ